MNNDQLLTRRNSLNFRLEELVKHSELIDKNVNQLLQEKEQVKANYNATMGALQLLDELLNPVEPVIPDEIPAQLCECQATSQ